MADPVYRKDLSVFPQEGTVINCKAILSDLDGTLVDSTVCVDYAVETWAEEHNLHLGELVQKAHGRRTIDIVKMFTPNLDVDAEVKHLEDLETSCTKGLVPIDGAAELVSRLSPHHFAVVTSGSHKLATHRLSHTKLPIPKVFITADDVTLGKPNPEPYLLASERLGLNPSDCLVFEDSPNGIKSAKEAGMRVVAIAVRSSDHDIAQADYIVHDMTWITVRVKPDTSLELTLKSSQET
jgi:sugar-phosphatase